MQTTHLDQAFALSAAQSSKPSTNATTANMYYLGARTTVPIAVNRPPSAPGTATAGTAPAEPVAAPPRSESALGAETTPDVVWDEATERLKLIEFTSRQCEVARQCPFGTKEQSQAQMKAFAALADEIVSEVPPAYRASTEALLLVPIIVDIAAIWGVTHSAVQESDLPPRFKELRDESGGFSNLVKNIQQLSLPLQNAMSWFVEPLTPIQMEFAFKGKLQELQEVYLQTMRENFYLEQTTVALKKRFLNEEQVRLDHGYYAPELVPALTQLKQKLFVNAEKLERDFSSNPDADRNNVLNAVAPLASTELMDKTMAIVAHMGLWQFPFKYEPLTHSQQQALDLLLKEGLRSPHAPDLLAFLEGLYSDAVRTGNAWLSWAQSDPNAGALQNLAILLDISYHYLTHVCNILGRRVRGAQHQELPLSLNTVMQDAFSKSDPDMALAWFPQYNTVGALGYEQAVAQKNAPESQASESAPQPAA